MNIKKAIQFKLPKAIIGAVLAVLSLVLCGACGAWYIGFIFCAVFLLAGCIKIHCKRLWCALLWFIPWLIAMIYVTQMAPAFMLDVVGQTTISPKLLALNYVCIAIVITAVFTITAKPKLSVGIGSFLLLALSTVNGIVYQFRGKELGLMDVFSIQTAINVAGQYTPQITFYMIFAWLLWLALILIGFSLPSLPKLPRWRTRAIALFCTFILILPLKPLTENVPIKTWATEGTRLNGFYLNLYAGMRDATVKKPENYNLDDIENLAQQYLATDKIENADERPNVIVVMNESFADLRVFGNIKTNRSVMPFVDSLYKNTVRGKALASVYGGNTANSEFEFLTGHSMAFFPDFSVPYQQYIRSEIFTLAHLMQSYGYESVATHPFWANGWSRNVVYPYFGFEKSTFLEDYTVNSYLREYVSDRDMYAHMLKILTDTEREKPLFLFSITMQNHGGYNYENPYFEEPVELVGYEKEYPLANQYLSLIHESDAAIHDLITTLASYPEDTVVLFFGDHLPMLDDRLYEEIYGGSFNSLTEQMLHYTVPFFIWANYDIPEETVEMTSINYLPVYLLKTAGLPLSPYLRFLEETETVIPAINSLGYYSISQNTFLPLEAANGEEKNTLNQYASLTYNQLFDKKNRNSLFFH